jgi:hypothetical protein
LFTRFCPGLIFQSCATHHAQFSENIKQPVTALNADIKNGTIFLIGMLEILEQ